MSPARPPFASPSIPAALPIEDALARSAPLSSLRQRMSDSAARLDAVRGALPPPLFPHVAAGPLDDEGWTLLAANPAVATKLRHLQPLIEAALRQRGWPPRTLRIKVAGR